MIKDKPEIIGSNIENKSKVIFEPHFHGIFILKIHDFFSKKKLITIISFFVYLNRYILVGIYITTDLYTFFIPYIS